jgi:hypothetical protein
MGCKDVEWGLGGHFSGVEPSTELKWPTLLEAAQSKGLTKWNGFTNREHSLRILPKIALRQRGAEPGSRMNTLCSTLAYLSGYKTCLCVFDSDAEPHV